MSRLAFAAVAVAACFSGSALAQAYLDPASIGKSPVDAWTTFHGDHSGQHYSPLNQINRSNVKGLQLAWEYRLNTSPQGAIVGGTVETPVPVTLGGGALNGGLMKATPLLVDGVLYFSAPDHAWAVDARNGREIWHYYWKTSGGEYIGNRGVAIYKGWLFFGTPDGHLVSLDAATGKERWHKQIGEVRQNYYSSGAPVIVGDRLLVGLSGDALDVPGWLEARDPETGDVQWKFYTTPSKGEPGADSWPTDFAREHGGGMTWQPITYDPELNLIYLPTGNPNPVYAPELRKGDNLYSCSIVAIDPKTGKMVWYYQTSPNEAWDFDANQVPVLIDTVIDGKPRKVVAQATRNGFYFMLDRTNGQHIVTSKLTESVNWSTGLNAKGQPMRDNAKLNTRGGALISPSNGGVQNWTAPAYMPRNGLLYINAMQGYDIHYAFGPPDPITGELGHRAQGVGGYDLSLRAIDIKTGKVKWSHPYAGSEFNPPRPQNVGALLATAGDLVFSGAPAGGPGGFFVAYDPDNGRQIWHATLRDAVSNTPITYMMDGRQYLIFAANDTVYAYAAPLK